MELRWAALHCVIRRDADSGKTQLKLTSRRSFSHIVLKDLGLLSDGPIKLYYDNQAAMNISHNQFQNDRTKHIELIDIL